MWVILLHNSNPTTSLAETIYEMHVFLNILQHNTAPTKTVHKQELKVSSVILLHLHVT
jgi:hypothetical protein